MEETKNPNTIFILSGQSNMAGRGGIKDRKWDGFTPHECRPHPSILRFSSSSCWEPAADPLHADIDVTKPCGVGPAMAFANAVVPHLSHAIGLVPCAIGGTAIKEWEKGSLLYNEMVRRAREAAESGGEIAAVLWFQGESDTLSDEAAREYSANMERFIRDVRFDLNLPSLPFVQVAIASGVDESRVEKIREAQLGIDLHNVVYVDAKGLPLDEDCLHLSTPAQVALGKMLAEAYIKNFLNPKSEDTGPSAVGTGP